ncbi:hypothetical protein HK405_010381, partial [Cladochytrium tenue]
MMPCPQQSPPLPQPPPPLAPPPQPLAAPSVDDATGQGPALRRRLTASIGRFLPASAVAASAADPSLDHVACPADDDISAAAAEVKAVALTVMRSCHARVNLGHESGIWAFLAACLVLVRNRLLSNFGVPGAAGIASEPRAIADLALATAAFQLLRNMCAAVPENQICSAHAGIADIAEEMLSYLCSWLVTTEQPCSTVKEKATACVHIGAQMMANFMTGNPQVQNQLWPRFFRDSDLLKQLLRTRDENTLKTVLLCTYNCIYKDRQRSLLLLTTPIGRQILMNFLRLARDRLESDDEIFDIVYGIFCNLLELDLASETLRAITLSQSRASPSPATSPSSPSSSSFPPLPPVSATAKMSDEHVVFLKFVDGFIDTRLRNTAGATDSTHPPQQQPTAARATATPAEPPPPLAVIGDAACQLFVGLLVFLAAHLDRQLPPLPADAAATASASNTAPGALPTTFPPAPTPDITAAATAAAAASAASALVNDLHAAVLLMQYLSCALRPDAPLVAASTRTGLPARRRDVIRAGLPAALAAMLALPDRIAAPLSRAPGGTRTQGDAVAAAVPESVSRALFMLKVDAVKVIANLAYRCKEAQDE